MSKDPNKYKGKVLILDAELTQTLIMAEELHKSGYWVGALCDGKMNYGYYCTFVDKSYVGPVCHEDMKAYHSFMLSFLKDNKYDVLLPLSDATAEYMSIYKEELTPLVGVLMPNVDVFQKAYDKNLLMTLCREKGYPHPMTIDMAKTNLSSEEYRSFPYPALIKPNHTSGGRGMTLVSSYEELKSVYPSIHDQYGECHLQQYIRAGGRQVKIELFVNDMGKTVAMTTIHKQRYYPENGGSSCCNVTIPNDKEAQICAKILNDIGWTGFADFDLIENPDTNQLLIMEINPRMPACIKSVSKSGVWYAELIADATMGRQLKQYDYKPGKALRHIGFDFLWFIHSENRFKTKPSWFKFVGRSIYYQDMSKWYDPLPFICGTLGNIKKMLNPEFRKSKSGLRK